MTAQAEGWSLPCITKEVTLLQVRTFAKVCGDPNPIHLEPEFASKADYSGIIAQGMLTLAFINEMLTLAFGISWLATGKLRVRFQLPAYPGDEVCTFGSATNGPIAQGYRLITSRIGLKNQRGDNLISGVASVSVPANQ